MKRSSDEFRATTTHSRGPGMALGSAACSALSARVTGAPCTSNTGTTIVRIN